MIYYSMESGGISEDWPVMEIKSQTRDRIIKSLIKRAGSMAEKYKIARKFVKGSGPFAEAVRKWYDLKIRFHSTKSCENCDYHIRSGCPGQKGMCPGYKKGTLKVALDIGEPERG